MTEEKCKHENLKVRVETEYAAYRGPEDNVVCRRNQIGNETTVVCADCGEWMDGMSAEMLDDPIDLLDALAAYSRLTLPKVFMMLLMGGRLDQATEFVKKHTNIREAEVLDQGMRALQILDTKEDLGPVIKAMSEACQTLRKKVEG